MLPYIEKVYIFDDTMRYDILVSKMIY